MCIEQGGSQIREHVKHLHLFECSVTAFSCPAIMHARAAGFEHSPGQAPAGLAQSASSCSKYLVFFVLSPAVPVTRRVWLQVCRLHQNWISL